MTVSVGTKSAVTAYEPASVCVAAPPVRTLLTAPGTEPETVAALPVPS